MNVAHEQTLTRNVTPEEQGLESDEEDEQQKSATASVKKVGSCRCPASEQRSQPYLSGVERPT